MTMQFRSLLLGLALATPLAPAFAQDFKIGAITIEHPYAIVTSPKANSGVGYISITNQGDTPDRLMAVEADFPKVEMHDTRITEGVASMVPVEAVELAPGETVTFTPRGLHVMFMGLTAPFKVGDKIPATLVFETAGATEIEFNVQSRGAVSPMKDAPAMDHSKMDHPKKGEPPMDHMNMDHATPPIKPAP